MGQLDGYVVNVGGEDIYCKAIVNDVENKTLILVHGASANADSWMPVIPYFSERVNIIALDMPGHYRSGGRLRESIAEMADFINDFVKEAISFFSLKGEIVYVGHSLGGGIGIEIGVRQESWLNELILVTTSANLSVLEPEFIEKLKYGEFDTNFFKNGFSPFTSTKVLEAMLQRRGTTSVEAAYYDFLAGDKFDRTNDLHKINVNTLIISARDDLIMPYESQIVLREGIKNSIWVEIEAAGHFITIEQPQRLVNEIENFIFG